MMRGRSDGVHKKRLLTSVFIVAVFLVFLYAYFGAKYSGESALGYVIRSLRKLGSSYLGQNEDSDLGGKQYVSSVKFGLDDAEDGITSKNFPTSYISNEIEVGLSLMEHYGRHCPSPERRYNCLITPPPGYKVPIKWPKSRDEVWKANIPHTHLAREKSDQNWMVVKGDRINFPGGITHFHYGAEKYIASMANVSYMAIDIQECNP